MAERSKSQQFTHFPGTGTPKQIHLKEAFLSVQKPCRSSEVEAIRCVNGRYALLVPLNENGPCEASDGQLTVKPRQAPLKRQPSQHYQKKQKNR
jgi:hypothetical protein